MYVISSYFYGTWEGAEDKFLSKNSNCEADQRLPRLPKLAVCAQFT